LETAFLGALLECLTIKGDLLESMLAESILLEREKRTDGGNRMDLRISGQTWALVIENKIRHWVANPLEEYEDSAKKWAGPRKLYLMILSPAGGSPDPEKWIPVSYRHLVSRVRERMEATRVPSDSSKWRVFAEDFLLHIEQEICINPMKHEEIEFIETHLEDLPNIQRLRNDYMHHLWRLIHSELDAGENPSLELRWDSKYFLIRADNWSQWQLGLSGPDQMNLDDDGLLTVRIWSAVGTPALETIQKLHFPDYVEAGTDGPFKEYRRSFNNSADALGEIRRLYNILLGPPTTRMFPMESSSSFQLPPL
jgi:hypothetical protein